MSILCSSGGGMGFFFLALLTLAAFHISAIAATQENPTPTSGYVFGTSESVVSPDGRWLAALEEASTKRQPFLVVYYTVGQQRTRKHFVTSSVVVGKHRFRIEGSLKWSPDSRFVYFLLDFSATSAYLARFDVATGQAQALTDVIRYAVISKGEFSGTIVALKRKQTLLHPHYWYWLLDSKGNEIGPIGPPEDLWEFVERCCNEGLTF